MSRPEEIFARHLADRRRKLTAPRRLVLAAALALEGHFDLDGLSDWLRRQGTPVHRATIYRTLPALVECGLVRKILHGERRLVRYEHVVGHPHHYHLACVACGRIIEFRQPEIARRLEAVSRRHRFQPVERRLCIRGYCAACREKADGVKP